MSGWAASRRQRALCPMWAKSVGTYHALFNVNCWTSTIAKQSPVRADVESFASKVRPSPFYSSSCNKHSFKVWHGMGCGASKPLPPPPPQPVELVAKPWDGKSIDPGKQILLVRGSAVEKLARHPVHGGKTSHDMLSGMHTGYKEGGGTELKDDEGKPVGWTGGPSQITIMEKCGMFERTDFVVVTFEQLALVDFTVLSYTWSDSKWSELVGDSASGLKKVLPDMSSRFFWLDIFCLDQFSADKMKTIVRIAEIYEWASEYYGMGLVIFDRLWCLAETGCTGQNARRRKKMIMVTEFTGCLARREKAYRLLITDFRSPTFESSRCSVASDREIVKTRILTSGFRYRGFNSLKGFDNFIAGVVDSILAVFQAEEMMILKFPNEHLLEWDSYSFQPSDADADKCMHCDKLAGHHHVGTSKSYGGGDLNFCYDFLPGSQFLLW